MDEQLKRELKEEKVLDLVTCSKCGWVHFAVTRAHAEAEVERFNNYFNDLSPQAQQDYYGGKGSSIKSYEHCFLCRSSYKEMKDYKYGDCPDGCTIQPIIKKED